MRSIMETVFSCIVDFTLWFFRFFFCCSFFAFSGYNQDRKWNSTAGALALLISRPFPFRLHPLSTFLLMNGMKEKALRIVLRRKIVFQLHSEQRDGEADCSIPMSLTSSEAAHETLSIFLFRLSLCCFLRRKCSRGMFAKEFFPR